MSFIEEQTEKVMNELRKARNRELEKFLKPWNLEPHSLQNKGYELVIKYNPDNSETWKLCKVQNEKVYLFDVTINTQ